MPRRAPLRLGAPATNELGKLAGQLAQMALYFGEPFAASVAVFIHVHGSIDFNLQAVDAAIRIAVFIDRFGAGKMFVEGRVIAKAFQAFDHRFCELRRRRGAVARANIEIRADPARIRNGLATNGGHAVAAYVIGDTILLTEARQDRRQ